MKRIITIAAFASLLLSCANQDEGYLIKEFTPYVESFSLKSSIDPSSGDFTWEEGDEVLVSNGEHAEIYVYDASRGKFVTTNPIARTEKIQAVYPASYAKQAGSSLRVTLPSEQTCREDGSVSVVPMYLWRVRGDVFKFKSICGIARIELVGSGTALYEAPLEKVVFVSTSNPTSGTATLQDDGSLLFEESSKVLTLNCNEGMNAMSPVNLVLPPHKYPMGSKIQFFFSDGKIAESQTIMGIVPRANMVKTYTIEVTSDFFGNLEEYEDGESIDDNY